MDGRSYDELISTWFQIINSQHRAKFDVYERLKLTEFIWAFQGKDMPLWMWLEQISNKLQFDRSLNSYEQIFPDEVAEYRKLKELTRPGSELAEMTLQNFVDMTRGVQLTTIHSSKGMEFEVVIIAGIERIWDTDNGRRLLYVAVTRAEKEACLIYTKVWPEWNPSTPPHILNLENKCRHLPFFQSFLLHNK
jgi:superfamily I DNA/RNA helicase